jgi:PAS domain S-box-containing protein
MKQIASEPSGEHTFFEGTEERFRLLVDSVTDYAIFMLDTQGHILTWNSGAQRIKGYRADEILGQHFSRFYPPEALQRDLPETELRVAASEGRFEDEGWRVRKDGSLFWANVIITALRGRSGELRGFAKVTRDLTQRRENEERLRQSEERFRILVEGVIDYAIFMLDPNGYIATWNAGAQRIKGYLPHEIIGEHFSKFYPPDVARSGWPEHELQVATERGRFDDEGWRLRKDGSSFWASVVITALRDESGRLLGFSKLTRDLTERRRAEAAEALGRQREELLEAERTARIAAQDAARSKDEFLATLSHELRTPLSAILGWTQLLKRHREPKRDDVERAVEVIERNARAQVQLIEDLLDLSRIMSGRIDLDIRPITLGDVVQQAIESAEPAARAKSIRLEAPIEEPVLVSGDTGRLQQVVWNLLTNAIKFTGRGGTVQISMHRVNSHVEFAVSDTGIGIPATFLPHVFDRFSQGESSASRNYGGLGLGLAISKQLVELHGGCLRAYSAGEGQGATFTMILPLLNSAIEEVHPSELKTEPSALPDLGGIRVLLVDDESDTRDIIQRMLEKYGAIVRAVASGEEALRILNTSAPEVLISDIGMPGMDGYQLIRQIRAREPKRSHVPAIALTAFARVEDRKRAAVAGFQSHLAKPIEMAELVRAVGSLAGRPVG